MEAAMSHCNPTEGQRSNKHGNVKKPGVQDMVGSRKDFE
jgi:hypothetical protein